MYKTIFQHILSNKDPEEMHDKVIELGRSMHEWSLLSIVDALYGFREDKLKTEFMGIKVDNPVGLAAGFDKNAEVVNFMAACGFGFVEIGSVTAGGGNGNTNPRIFRLIEDQAIINRMGLNNQGAELIYRRLTNQQFSVPVGINLAKTHNPEILGDKAIMDFQYSYEKLGNLGSYIVLNVSCPNTIEGKTFEDPNALDELLSTIKESKKKIASEKPLLVKLSPDLDTNYSLVDEVLMVAEKHKVGGYIISNTTNKREGLISKVDEIGGLSGLPIQGRARKLVSYVYQQLDEPNIIGCGGINSAESAYAMIKAGASLVQLYTGMIYQGPSVVKEINKGLVSLIERDGFESLSQVVGVDVK